MAVPSNILAMTNGKSFNLSSTLGSGVLVLTPPSYVGWPTSGWAPLTIDSEIIYVTDFAIQPWPITRGEESTSAASHASGVLAANKLTAGVLTAIVGQTDYILSDDNGAVLVDDNGNVLYAS